MAPKKTTEELNAQIAAAAAAKAAENSLGEDPVEQPDPAAQQPELPDPAAQQPELPKEMPTESKKDVVSVVMVKHSSIYHPYQRRWVPEVMDGPIEMVLDSWLQCQIDAGLVKVVK